MSISSVASHAWASFSILLARLVICFVGLGRILLHPLGGMAPNASPTTEDAYFQARNRLIQEEKRLGFENSCERDASELEKKADAILDTLRQRDNDYYAKRKQREYKTRLGDTQNHARFAGDHFLSNRDLIDETALFKVAREMPKGAHLHIHYNACLPPRVLLDIAFEMDHMYIKSDRSLLLPDDLSQCQLEFSIRSLKQERLDELDETLVKTLFSAAYRPTTWMKLSTFKEAFETTFTDQDARDWLVEKMLFTEEETHNPLQTAAGAWDLFNARTRMMKGLFNYEKAFREYTRLFLEDLMRDNIQYAEIRPNFMESNRLWADDGSERMSHEDVVEIIIEEVTAFQTTMMKEGRFFGGLKIIYCWPRSMDRETVKEALAECLVFKQKWPEWIAGFDLVGEEAKGKPLKEFVPEFLDFQANCRAAGVDIPFLFHCGETLDFGTDTDANLWDALLLKSKRIGHGFALAKHPLIMQKMRDQGICVELCPISNEILGLTPRVNGHAMYSLLANNIPCTVNSDNGTMFRSTLSHDFYQVMVGKADMSLFGWKQLILWSIVHSCMNNEERSKVIAEWEKAWVKFLNWIVEYHDVTKKEDSQRSDSKVTST